MKQALHMIELFAGLDSTAKPVVERLPVRELESGNLQLVQSPAFVKGLASGDIIQRDKILQTFDIIQRSGNLSIRIFCRERIEELSDLLTPEMEKLGGELDLENPRMLVYSIHVSCGFLEIETVLDKATKGHGASGWMYGNVYDPQDGVTPLNWWQAILQEE